MTDAVFNAENRRSRLASDKRRFRLASQKKQPIFLTGDTSQKE